MSNFDWDAQAIAMLRALWANGHSAQQIGNRMGVTKNAVAGKAHRLGLVARPSPIKGVGAHRKSSRLMDETPYTGRTGGPRRTLAALGVVKQPAPLPNGAHPATKGDHRPLALRPRNTLGASHLPPPAVPPGGSPLPAEATAHPSDIAPAEVNACEGQARADAIAVAVSADGQGSQARRQGAGHFFFQTCQWIEGDPRRGAGFCAAEIPEPGPGRAYCKAHHARAFTRRLEPTQAQIEHWARLHAANRLRSVRAA